MDASAGAVVAAWHQDWAKHSRHRNGDVLGMVLIGTGGLLVDPVCSSFDGHLLQLYHSFFFGIYNMDLHQEDGDRIDQWWLVDKVQRIIDPPCLLFCLLKIVITLDKKMKS